MTSSWQTARRALMGIGLILILGGPSPGSVGSCGEDAQAANPVQFCIDRETWSCQRRWARGELDDTQRDDCLRPIDESCRGATWGTDCNPPTTLETDACIAALSDPARLGTDEDALPECQRGTLCGGGS